MALGNDDKKTKKAKEGNTVSDELDLESLGITETKRVSRKTLTEGIIRPRLNEIFTMVRLALDRESISTRIPAGAIITGGGAETVGLVDSAKRMLSLPVRIGNPKGVGGLIDDVIVPAFATCVGLILHGSNKEPNEVLTAFAKRFKLPSKGLASKIIENIRDLLPY